MRKKFTTITSLYLLSILALTGCANLNTIGRTTTIGSNDKQVNAVHLDIQQRLVISNAMGLYCAEPSPDALAAFAAAVGLGSSDPTKKAISASGSTSSSAASVGLRTQSITLMRDALYRMCEAYGNGQLSKAQVMTLLNRSQDLTAVVLATEQLTGAISAQQAAISSSSSADATSLMTVTSKLLDLAIKQHERSEDRFEQAMLKENEAEAALKAADTELNAAKIYSSENTGNDAAGQAARAREKNAQAAVNKAQLAHDSAVEIRELREASMLESKKRVESLSGELDSAASSAAATSAGNAVLSGEVDRSRLSDQSAQAISKAVSDMVSNVVNKSYVLEYCMALVSAPEEKSGVGIFKAADLKDVCMIAFESSANAEAIRITGHQYDNQADEAKGKKDADCIRKWSKIPGNENLLTNWTKSKNTDSAILLNTKDGIQLRQQAISDLKIECK